MAKRVLTTSILILLFSLQMKIFAQNLDNAIVNDYNRNSVSEIYVRYYDSYNGYIQKLFVKNNVSDKFDINEIPLKFININGQRDNKQDDLRINPNRTGEITKILNEKNVGLDVVSYIFNRDSNGKMDLSRIHERGLYTASDIDVRLSSSKVRGLFDLEDFGHELLNKSYIIVYDFVNIRKEKSELFNDDNYKGQTSAYIFQIQWSNEIEAMIFDSWIDEDTPKEQVAEKLKLYNDIYIPVKCVSRVTANTSVTSDKSSDLNTWAQTAYENISHEIQKTYSDFSVVSSITNISPIRSKIGLKEGLKPGLRFYVYENVMKGNGEVTKSRQGVLRASHNIVDNRQVATGASAESEFKQIAGKKLETGQTLLEKRDLGLSLSAGYSSTLLRGESNDTIAGNVGGFHIDISYEMFLKSKIASSYVLLACNFESDALNVTADYAIGLSIRNFEILPYVGFGLDSYSTPDAYISNDDKTSAWFVHGGLRAHVNIFYPVQLVAACEWNQTVSSGSDYRELSGTKLTIEDIEGKIETFKYRNINGLHAFVGLRICF